MTVRVPFGKHRGALLTNLPEDYLMWLCNPSGPDENFVKRNKLFFDLAHKEWNRRLKGDPIAPKGKELTDSMRKFLPDLVDAGCKVMAQRHHPDKGGSEEDMKNLLALRAYLKGL